MSVEEYTCRDVLPDLFGELRKVLSTEDRFFEGLHSRILRLGQTLPVMPAGIVYSAD